MQVKSPRRKTYGDGGEEYAGSGEEVLVIKALPDRVPPANAVRVDGDLSLSLASRSGTISERSHLGIKPELLGELHKDLRVCTLYWRDIRDE